MAPVNFSIPAGVYLMSPVMPRRWKGKLRYKRFATLAEAIRFVVEALPAGGQQGASIEADDIELASEDIHCLYASESYPLVRGPQRARTRKR